MVKSKSKKILVQDGGEDIISATGNLISSMTDLGRQIFNEIQSITHIGTDINTGAAPLPGTPGQIQSPPPFNQPAL